MNPYLDDLKRDNEAKHALQAVAVNDFRGAEVAGSDLSSFPEHSLTSPLPDGWHKMLSPTTGKHFFINHELKMKTWEDPRKQGKQAIADNQNSSTTLVKSDQQTEMVEKSSRAILILLHLTLCVTVYARLRFPDAHCRISGGL